MSIMLLKNRNIGNCETSRNLESKQGRNSAKQNFKNKSRKALKLAHFNKPIGFIKMVSPTQLVVLNCECIHDAVFYQRELL